MDGNLNYINHYNPPVNPTKVDNDFGATITVFNHPSEGQTSGCKKTLVAAARKDAILFITDDQANILQTIDIGDRTTNIAFIAGSSWDPYSNTLMIANAKVWTDSAGKFHDKGIHGLRLDSTCQLKEVWFAPISSPAQNNFIHGTIVGPPGQRFLLRNEQGLMAINVQTGALIVKVNAASAGPAPVTVAGGYVVIASYYGTYISAYKIF